MLFKHFVLGDPLVSRYGIPSSVLDVPQSPQTENLLLIQHHDTSREITFRREIPFINTEFPADQVHNYRCI